MNTTNPADVSWNRSSFCGSGACVDVRRVGDTIEVRDGNLGDDSLIQEWPLADWRDLIAALAQGEDALAVLSANDGSGVYLGAGDALFFDNDDWNAFVAGVKAGEFEPDRLSGSAPSEGYDAGLDQVGDVGGGSDHAATGAGEAVEASGEPVPVAAHHHTAGWGGVPGQCGVECACGTTFDGFDTIAEAAALLDDHIAAAAPVPAVLPVPVAAPEDDDERQAREDWQSVGDEPVETPEQSAAIVDANLRDMGSRGLDAVPPVPVAAHAQGYAEAVARLRDDARYTNWWTSDGVKPDGPIRQHLADYLETVGPPVPVAAQPTYILDRDAIVDMVERYGNTCVAAVVAGLQGLHDAVRKNANQADDLLHAIRGALTPVPTVEPEPRWGSGPLVEHNPEVWSGSVAPGGYVCGAPDPTRPDGICGMPVESEPCPEHVAEAPNSCCLSGQLSDGREHSFSCKHNPETPADSRLREAAVRAAVNGGADPVLRTPGAGSADLEGGAR